MAAMTWTAPDVPRTEGSLVADERDMLEEWLDWHRSTLLHKCAGLTGEQLAERSVPPSNLSLLGLIRHMTDVERQWFRQRFGGEDIPLVHSSDGDWSADFDAAKADTAHEDYKALLEEMHACREAITGRDLDETYASRYGPMSLRWIMNHMIEEYARHNGHADLLRERIDGRTGS